MSKTSKNDTQFKRFFYVCRPTSNSYISSCGTNASNKSFNTTKGNAMLESFRIPFDPRTIRSIDSRGTSNAANSTYL